MLISLKHEKKFANLTQPICQSGDQQKGQREREGQARPKRQSASDSISIHDGNGKAAKKREAVSLVGQNLARLLIGSVVTISMLRECDALHGLCK